MASIEGLHKGTPIDRDLDPVERRRDYHFRYIVNSHLVDTFREALEEAHFPQEQVGDLSERLAELPANDAHTVLALPYEIRGRLFGKYRDQIAEGSLTPQEMLDDILKKNRSHGFTLGYHISSRQIPIRKKPGGGEEWNVEGSELDDRDDMPMAYYSEDYLSRYKKQNGQYLYIVRAEVGPASAHKRDLKNRWGRAPYLSIIGEFPLNDIEKEIDEAMQKENAATGNR